MVVYCILAQETLPTDVEKDGYCPLSTFSVSLLSTCQFYSFMGTPTFEYSMQEKRKNTARSSGWADGGKNVENFDS